MSKHPTHRPYLSIVIPVFNEVESIDKLYSCLTEVLTTIGESYEIILVDDGSSDGTIAKIRSFDDPTVNLISFIRNFGHQAAIHAGLDYAKGEVVITMDGDLQHPPEVIPKLLEQYIQGYEVVNTHRIDSQNTGFLKKITSRLFYSFFSFLTGVKLSSGSSDFRLISRNVLKHLTSFADVDLFLRGAIEWLGYEATTIPFNAGDRFAGKSKFSIRKMYGLAMGSIVSFSIKPLILSIWIGLCTSLVAFIEILYVIYIWYQGHTVPGWASIMGVTSLLFGILFIILGIIGLYLSRIHMALQQRPRYIVAGSSTNE